MSGTDRIHGFDTLRSLALLLGILIHASMPYLEPSMPIWFVVDEGRSLGYTVLVMALHAFRLQTFFFLAGFFASLLIEKRGLSEFVENRIRRIVIPLLLAILLIVPLLQLLMIAGYAQREGAGIMRVGSLALDSSAYRTTAGEFFGSGRFLGELLLFHLWFLYYLVMIYIVYLLSRFAVIRAGLSSRFLAFGGAVLKSRLGPVGLALPTAGIMWQMNLWQADTPFSVIPDPVVIAYYLLFFLVGVAAFRNETVREKLEQHSPVWLISAFLLLPLAIGLQAQGPTPASPGNPVFKAPALVLYSLYSWGMVLGLVGGFSRWFKRPDRRIRLVSETAYWQYLMHLPLLVAMQILLFQVPCWSLLKILLQTTVAFTILYYSYVFCLGRTFIGRMLNGRTVSELRE